MNSKQANQNRFISYVEEIKYSNFFRPIITFRSITGKVWSMAMYSKSSYNVSTFKTMSLVLEKG